MATRKKRAPKAPTPEAIEAAKALLHDEAFQTLKRQVEVAGEKIKLIEVYVERLERALCREAKMNLTLASLGAGRLNLELAKRRRGG